MRQVSITRRSALAASVALSTAATAREARSDTLNRRLPWAPDVDDRPTEIDTRPGYLFFAPDEAAFVEAAVARLIPNDELGPGALEADVPRFIDRQLVGPYGQGDHFYLRAPAPKGTATQGWQMGAPADVYRATIPQVNRWSAETRGAAFARLSSADQDAVLGMLERGEAQLMGGVDGKAFFALLLQNTVEGFFADPLYGGNRDMVGWRLIGFPGARYDYRDFVSRHGEAYDETPVSLKGRREWKRR